MEDASEPLPLPKKNRLSSWTSSEGFDIRKYHALPIEEEVHLGRPTCLCKDADVPKTGEPFYTQLGACDKKEALASGFHGSLKCLLGLPSLPSSSVTLTEVFFKTWEAPACVTTAQVVAHNGDIITRGGEEELLRVLYRVRPGHYDGCNSKYVTVAFILWDALTLGEARQLYEECTPIVPYWKPGHGKITKPASKAHEEECFCQGRGALRKQVRSYTVGCTWSNYDRTCKWGTSPDPRPYANFPDDSPLTPEQKQDFSATIRTNVDGLADKVGLIFKHLCSQAFETMTANDQWSNCRVGTPGDTARPFSSVTFLSDMSCHSHYDENNLRKAACGVVTIREPGTENNSTDQFHLITNYSSREGSKEGNLALDLSSGSLLVECANLLKHSTSAIACPNPKKPKRFVAVLVQSIRLDLPLHGSSVELAQDEVQRDKLREQGFT